MVGVGTGNVQRVKKVSRVRDLGEVIQLKPVFIVSYGGIVQRLESCTYCPIN